MNEARATSCSSISCSAEIAAARGIAVKCPQRIAGPLSSERWRDLMVSAQMGDAQAYRRLIDELYQWFRRYYARRLPYDAAEETAQEALLAVHAKRHTYTSSRPFGPWVLAIARYKWVDRIREIKKANIVCLGNDIAVPDHGSAVAARIAVSGLLKKLKPGQAEAIRIVRLQGDTIEGAALRTGQSEALVKVNVHRGMKKLSAMLNIQSGQS